KLSAFEKSPSDMAYCLIAKTASFSTPYLRGIFLGAEAQAENPGENLARKNILSRHPENRRFRQILQY
ncbi:MAG: hypothetical protein IIZ18_06895, partial [Ruminococcus sp.]|nr:hypothetical protein [Ruminococcus sp.]